MAQPVVSSAPLAAGASPALSEVEYGLILAGHAFHRWMMVCVAAAGVPGLSPTEVLVLRTVHHRARPKRLAEILLALAIEDTHIVTYAIRKLEGAGLVKTSRGRRSWWRPPPPALRSAPATPRCGRRCWRRRCAARGQGSNLVRSRSAAAHPVRLL
ncbi:winged helix DNA-binding protein [Siccirubricoccus deserti]